MKATFTFDRAEIEELIRQRLCKSGKVNEATDFLFFNFGEKNKAHSDIIVTVEVDEEVIYGAKSSKGS